MQEGCSVGSFWRQLCSRPNLSPGEGGLQVPRREEALLLLDLRIGPMNVHRGASGGWAGDVGHLVMGGEEFWLWADMRALQGPSAQLALLKDLEQDQAHPWGEGVRGVGGKGEALPYSISRPQGWQRQRKVVEAKAEDLKASSPLLSLVARFTISRYTLQGNHDSAVRPARLFCVWCWLLRWLELLWHSPKCLRVSRIV